MAGEERRRAGSNRRMEVLQYPPGLRASSQSMLIRYAAPADRAAALRCSCGLLRPVLLGSSHVLPITDERPEVLLREVRVAHRRAQVSVADGLLDEHRALALGEPGRHAAVAEVVLVELGRQSGP